MRPETLGVSIPLFLSISVFPLLLSLTLYLFIQGFLVDLELSSETISAVYNHIDLVLKIGEKVSLSLHSSTTKNSSPYNHVDVIYFRQKLLSKIGSIYLELSTRCILERPIKTFTTLFATLMMRDKNFLSISNYYFYSVFFAVFVVSIVIVREID